MAVTSQHEGDRAPGDRRAPRLLSDAQDFIAGSYGIAVGAETVPSDNALGRILARDLIAGTDLPRFDSSAMDGYAVNSADIADSAVPRLRIVGRATAGHPSYVELRHGEAVRIFTGAAVPAGADCVVMQEDCHLDDGYVVPLRPTAKANIRHKGEDVASGSLAIAKGTRLGPAELALAAALHCRMLPVHRPLKVAIFSTGDELRPPSTTIGSGQIADANRPLLRSLIGAMGCEIEDGGILGDDPETQIAALIDAATRNDLIVTSGGASVGEEDHLTRVIRRRGYLEIWRLKIKPGKPVGIGDIDDCPILALPGNPVAAAVTLLMLGTPLIGRLSGRRDLRVPSIRLPAHVEIAKRPGRWEAISARLVEQANGLTAVEPLAKANSAMLSSLVGADGFITLPEDVERVRPGDAVAFVTFPNGR